MVAKTINISGLMTIVCLLLPQRPQQTLQKLETLTCSNISGCTDATVLFYTAADTVLSGHCGISSHFKIRGIMLVACKQKQPMQNATGIFFFLFWKANCWTFISRLYNNKHFLELSCKVWTWKFTHRIYPLPTRTCMSVCSVVTDSLWPYRLPASMSTGFSRQEYWNGLPFPSPTRI